MRSSFAFARSTSFAFDICVVGVSFQGGSSLLDVRAIEKITGKHEGRREVSGEREDGEKSENTGIL